MSKSSRGAARFAAGKKKAKKQYGSPSIAQASPDAAVSQPVQAEATGSDRGSDAPALQFRPRGRSIAGRGSAGARTAVLQTIDYGYVYTDLKIIGGLSVVLIGGLIALSQLIH